MKKVLSLALFSLFTLFASAQLEFQATVIPGPTANSIDVLLRPNMNFAGYLSNVIFVLQLPETGSPQPTIGIENLAANFTTASYTQETDGATNGTTPGYNNYRISTGINANTTAINIASGTAYPLVRLTFNGEAVTLTSVRIANLPSGGPTNTFQFYVEANATTPATGANDYTYYEKMFYGPNSFPTAPFPDENTGYTSYQYVSPSPTLPVKWLSFSAVRQASNVAINWGVGAEESVSGYEVEVSTNGSLFSRLATKASLGRSNYDYIDQGVARYNSKQLYYRVKQIDVDGAFTYSPVKTVRLDIKGNIALYPNPAREGFTLNIPYLQANDQRVLLQLVNGAGQVLESRNITRQQAVNYYYNIQPSIPSGDYLLKIFEDGSLTETKQVLIKR